MFYLQINVKDYFKLILKLIFLHTGKHENLAYIDTMILMLMVKHSQNPQNSKFAMFLQYLKKEDMKLIFCM